MTEKSLRESEIKQQEVIEEKVFSVEKFFNDNKKIIWTILCLIVLCGVAIILWQKYYVHPKATEAKEQMFPAENNFAQQKYDIALNGDGNVLGFAQIIKDYGNLAGEAVYLYAGVCELYLNNYDQALAYLKKYKGKDKIMEARAYSCQGDAYVGLKNYKEALEYYVKASKVIDNQFAAAYLFKAAGVCVELKDNAQALKYYKQIKDQYPQSIEAYSIDKYISSIENAPLNK